MPSNRRVKILALAISITVFMMYYFTSDARRSQAQDFYSTTVAAMERQEAKQASDAEINQKLKDKKQEARINKAPPPVGGAEPLQAPLGPETTLSAEVPVKDSAERKPGRTRIKGGEKWDMNTGKEAAMVVDKEGMTKEEKKKTKEDHDVEMELNSILKKGPIIIFSKSYCPYSRKAKDILLDKYTITPAPYVVELDEHPLGPGLQSALEKSTGRRTVPNILINGKSIGGGDDVEALDQKEDLIGKVKSMGGKRIMEAKLKVPKG